ncbi:MAG: RHS repeat-associated core domain-containing protein [Burkholderiaceae bacterium]
MENSATFTCTTYYLNGQNNDLGYEKEIKDNGLTEHKHYLEAGGMVFALQVTRSGNLTTGGTGGSAKPAQSLTYLHVDHLGSVAVVTDDSGSVIERLAFDPWGKRRFPNGMADSSDSIVGLTLDRGYTLHEQLDEMGVIHMNGRIYDPLIGRFMSADPFIQAPENLQSHNRYAYVMNNPLSYTDPSGYFSLKKLFRAAVVIAVAYFTGGAVLGSSWALCTSAGATWGSVVAGAVGGFAGSLVASGGDLKAAFQGALTGAIFAGIGSLAQAGQWGDAARIGAHAAGGCITSVAGGGQCGSGALAAGFGKFATLYGPGWVQNPQGFEQVASGTAYTAVAGGIGSVLGGGKFENGARTAAYGYLFNQVASANGKPNLAPNLERTSYVVAEGGQFSMYDADGRLIDRVAFTSGRDGVTDPSIKDRGPIPPGTYALDPKNITPNGPNTLLSGDWGALRVSLTPTGDTNTFGRSGFYVHGGFAPGSAGCIDLGTPTDWRVLGQFKNLSSPIEVRVR